jgi:pimeloyl-ACP methyl ester carboxylesterase
VGVSATIIFVAWSLLAYRATPEAARALEPDARISVTRTDVAWVFEPAVRKDSTGLLFFAGALVAPAAYAPLMRAVAESGRVVALVELPRRGAFGGAEGGVMPARAGDVMRRVNGVDRWVAAGHSLGGRVAAQVVRQNPARFSGLILIGTSHPRDFSLAQLRFPVAQVYGTRDTVADVEKVEAARANLPVSTRIVAIEGGNHSQFGYYGFQPGDWPATISRDEQHRLTRQAIADLLDAASR